MISGFASDELDIVTTTSVSSGPDYNPEPHKLQTAIMVEHDALVLAYSHQKHFPREKDALHMLKKIASVVKPIMRARGWKVGELAEFYPEQHNLLGTCGSVSWFRIAPSD